jgi:hypothetical protein
MADEQVMGPISYLIVEFPQKKANGDALAELVGLVDRGIVRVLDLTFIARDEDGTVAVIEIADLDGDGELDLLVFEGASAGLMDPADINEAGSILSPGSIAAVLVFENTWATPFTSALRRNGAELIAAGYIPQDDLLAVLDAVEAAS